MNDTAPWYWTIYDKVGRAFEDEFQQLVGFHRAHINAFAAAYEQAVEDANQSLNPEFNDEGDVYWEAEKMIGADPTMFGVPANGGNINQEALSLAHRHAMPQRARPLASKRDRRRRRCGQRIGSTRCDFGPVLAILVAPRLSRVSVGCAQPG